MILDIVLGINLQSKLYKINYLTRIEIKERTAKSIAKTIVALKITFSKPLLVWYPAFQLSAPPKAPPELASDCCTKIDATINMAKTICIYGKYVIKVVITTHIIAK